MDVNIYIQHEQQRCQNADKQTRLLHICRGQLPLYSSFFYQFVFFRSSFALLHLQCQSDHVGHVQVRPLSFYTVRLISHAWKADALQMMQTGRHTCQDLGVAYMLRLEVNIFYLL